CPTSGSTPQIGRGFDEHHVISDAGSRRHTALQRAPGDLAPVNLTLIIFRIDCGSWDALAAKPVRPIATMAIEAYSVVKTDGF
ncbi:hypothetical protein LTR56_028259, partial [Elasticomyces elasticus]